MPKPLPHHWRKWSQIVECARHRSNHSHNYNTSILELLKIMIKLTFNLLNMLKGNFLLVGWLCFTSHRQLGHLETAPPFTVPCEGHKRKFYTIPTRNRTLGRHVAVHITPPLRHTSSNFCT